MLQFPIKIDGSTGPKAPASWNVRTLAGSGNPLLTAVDHDNSLITLREAVNALDNRFAGINANHVFVDDSARDAYFASNPDERVDGVRIVVDGSMQMWDGEAWQDLNVIVALTIPAEVYTVAGIADDVVTVAGMGAGLAAVIDNIFIIGAIAADLDGANTIGAVAAIDTEVGLVAGIAGDVEAVAGVAAHMGTVAGIDGEITTVAGLAAHIPTVAGIAAEIGTVAGISTHVSTVHGIAANVSKVAGIDGNVTTVAGNSTNINKVAAIDTNVSKVADIDVDVSKVALIDADVTAVASIDNDVTAVAGMLVEIEALVNDTWGQWYGAWADPSPGTYARNSAVEHLGSTWVANKDTAEEPGLSATDWDLAAKKGADGEGTGDVEGPASSVTGRIPQFADTTGKVLSDSGKSASDIHSAATVQAPLAITGQEIRLVNNAGTPATITVIDVGTLDEASDVKVPTSKAVATAIAAAGGGDVPITAEFSILTTDVVTRNAAGDITQITYTSGNKQVLGYDGFNLETVEYYDTDGEALLATLTLSYASGEWTGSTWTFGGGE